MKRCKLLVIFLLTFLCINTYNAEKLTVALSKCVDGDTARFILEEEEIKVRFLAIDTPETVHPNKDVEVYGKDASEYTCKMLTDASIIEIEYDEGSDKLDKYNRHLAWIFVDGELLQEKLVRIGYAEVKYLYGNYMYTDILKDSEDLAKNEKLGIWNDYVEEKAKEEQVIEVDINGNKVEVSKDNTKGIILIIILLIILALTKSKTKVKLKTKNKSK